MSAKPNDPALRAPVRIARATALEDRVELSAFHQKQLAIREINVKEAFTLVDETGTFFRASRKAEDEALVYEKMRASPEAPIELTLVCAVLGRQRMLPVIQKATELGCARIVPVLSDHAVPPNELDKEKPWSWASQAIRACRQCRRASVPEVLPATPLAKALEFPWWRDAGAKLVLDDRVGATDPLAAPLPGTSIAVAVGPEGGWSAAELQRMADVGAVPLALGPRVLRAETAVYAALAIVQHRFGDMHAPLEVRA